MSNNHKFLTNKTSFLVSDLVSLLSKRTMFDGNISDAKILDDISNSLNDEPPLLVDGTRVELFGKSEKL